MTKICKPCSRVYADRYSYCGLCGKQLEMYDGKWVDCSHKTHEDLYDELQTIKLDSKFTGAVTVAFAVISIGVGAVLTGAVSKNIGYSLSGLALYFVGLGVFIFGLIKTKKRNKIIKSIDFRKNISQEISEKLSPGTNIFCGVTLIEHRV